MVLPIFSIAIIQFFTTPVAPSWALVFAVENAMPAIRKSAAIRTVLFAIMECPWLFVSSNFRKRHWSFEARGYK